MRLMHGYPVACVLAAMLVLSPANAAPQRVVSTFLCTDEYVFRFVPRAHIAALSFLAADTHPVVSTIQSAVAGIPLTRLGATGGKALAIAGERPMAVAQLKESFERWLPAFMAGQTT